VTLDETEAPLRACFEALPQAARAELLHVRRLPDFDHADAIVTFWGHQETRTFGELPIDLEEDRTARAVGFGLWLRWNEVVMASRSAEIAFGVVAIVVGVGVVIAVAAGLEPSSMPLVVLALAVIGWLVYYAAVARRR
jgi:hypothetical protein